MLIPLLEFEGTWEEITAQLPDLSGQKLRVLVYPVTENGLETLDTRPIAEVLAEIAEQISLEEVAKLPSDFTDQLDHYIYDNQDFTPEMGYILAHEVMQDDWDDPKMAEYDRYEDYKR